MIKTNGSRLFLAIAAVLVTMAGQLHAAQINGLINFNGTVTLNTGSAGTANRVTGWFGPNGNPNVAGATGDFSGFVTPGTTTAAFVAPWFFASAAIPAFSTIDGFTFNLTESHVTVQTSSAVTVSGTGFITGNGYDPTPGVWTFTTQNPAAAGRFSFSASIRAVPCTGTIGDFVWQDLNRNGIQDMGEPGIDGVVVELRDSSDNLLRTTVTGPNGFYQFTGVCAGTYKVRIDNSQAALAGFVQTQTSPPGGGNSTNDSNPNPATVMLPANNSSDQTIDFGYYIPCTGRIGDFIWWDANHNGIQDGGEPGIDGVTVELQDENHNVLQTTITGPNGYYQFTGLCAGTYIVYIDNSQPGLAGYTPTTVNAPGSTQDNDSNANPFTVILPADDTSNQSIDFGYKVTNCTGRIGDFVWNDTNGNGIQDGGEPGINGVTVVLKDSNNNVLQMTMTGPNPNVPGADGYYQFTGLCAGTYKVSIDNSQTTLGDFMPTQTNAPGSTNSNDSNPNPSTVILTTDVASDQTIDFGYKCLIRPCSLTVPNPLPTCGSSGNTLSGPAGMAAYEWSIIGTPGPGWQITAGADMQNMTYSAGTSGTATFQLRVTGQSGCQNVCTVTFGCNTPCVCASHDIKYNFNGTQIIFQPTAPQNYVWFISDGVVKNLPANQITTLTVYDQTITIPVSPPIIVSVPNAIITFSPTATIATTQFDTVNNVWRSTFPTSSLSGNIFYAGVAFQVPGPSGLPGGIKNVDWSGKFSTSTPGLEVKWQWSAAAYSRYTTDYNLLKIKPTDDNQKSLYQNSDHSGTAEGTNPADSNKLWKTYVVGGASGGGGSNYTGSGSSTISFPPCLCP